MGEVTLSTNGLLSKVSLLFNNPSYSDVEFHFLSEEGNLTMKIYGHKLILALQSKAFAYMFFEKGDPVPIIKLPASKQASFHDLIKFLYTDNVQLHTYEETQDLLELAKAYAVEELSHKCCDYIMKNQLTFTNIFSRYDYALKKNVNKLLDGCRNFVCCNTEHVIKSDSFHNASVDVVEDILKQDNLNLTTELDIIIAVIDWALEDLKKDNLSSKDTHLRQRLDIFLKYLRVLTLSSSEFEYLIENYNIFSSYETMIITRKILQPESNVKLSKDICCITKKRNIIVLDDEVSDEDVSEISLKDPHKSVSFESPTSLKDETKTFKDLSLMPSKVSVCTDQRNEMQSLKTTKLQAEALQRDRASILDAKAFRRDRAKRFYEVRNVSSEETKFSASRFKSTKFNSDPNLRRYGFQQDLQCASAQQGQLREYTIPLNKSENCFSLSFRDDIKSYITFKMKSGNLSLTGFELKVLSSGVKTEELKVFVHLQGFSSQTFSDLLKKELHNDFLTINFPKTMILKEGNKGELEVSIDNLHGNRCSSCCSNRQFELNNGLNFAVEITLNSNKKTDNGFLFLVSKLFYVPF